MSKTDSAFEAISAAIDQATDCPLSDAGLVYLREWCNGTGRDHVPRPEIFASDDGSRLIAKLCDVIDVSAGAFLESALEIRLALNPRVRHEIEPIDLYALNRILSTSGTRLCNEDPKPEM